LRNTIASLSTLARDLHARGLRAPGGGAGAEGEGLERRGAPIAVGGEGRLGGGRTPPGAYLLELRALGFPARVRARLRVDPDPGGGVRAVQLVGDAQGVVAELERVGADGVAGARTLLLWGSSGERRLVLRDPGLQVLAVTSSRVVVARGSRQVLVAERPSGETHGPFDLALAEGLVAGRQKDRVALRAPGRRAVLLP